MPRRISARQQPVMQDSIGLAVLETCQVIPDGVLCFMPSYSLMDKLVLRWKVQFPLSDFGSSMIADNAALLFLGHSGHI